jgi:hypothetical protein
MGTALGLALTGLIYDLSASPREGFRSATLFLASVSVLAGVVAASRGSDGGVEPAAYEKETLESSGS